MPVIDALLSIIKLQNLKAIHNNLLIYIFTLIVVINHKTTKFESNSQHKLVEGTASAKLLSITKLQNLKAIHNVLLQLRYTENVLLSD